MPSVFADGRAETRRPWFPLAIWPILLAAALLLGLLGRGDDFRPDRALAFWAHVAATLGLSGWIWCLPAHLPWPRRLALAAFGWLSALPLLGIVAPWSSLGNGALAALLGLAALPAFVGALLAGFAPGPRAVCAVFLPILWWAPLALSFALASLGLRAGWAGTPLGALGLERLLAARAATARASGWVPLRAPREVLPMAPRREALARGAPLRVLEAAPLSPEGGYRRGRLVLGGLERPWRGLLELQTGLRTWRWGLAIEPGSTRALVLRWLDEGRRAEPFLCSEDGQRLALEGADACLTGPAALRAGPPPRDLDIDRWAEKARPQGLRTRLLVFVALVLPLCLLSGALWWGGRIAPVMALALVLPLGWSWVWPGPPVLRLAVDEVLLRPGGAGNWHREFLLVGARSRVLPWRLREPWPAPDEPMDGTDDDQRDDGLRLRLAPGQIRGFYAPAWGPAPSLRPAGPGRWIIENPTEAALWLRPESGGAALWLGAGDACEWRPEGVPGSPARLSGRAQGLAEAQDGLPPGQRIWLWEVSVDG